jgi:hypothetical protein
MWFGVHKIFRRLIVNKEACGSISTSQPGSPSLESLDNGPAYPTADEGQPLNHLIYGLKYSFLRYTPTCNPSLIQDRDRLSS